tara:strand:+ start:1221 stop:1577 length:357 start_codon:yes stop_codon:yes gene_type:complete
MAMRLAPKVMTSFEEDCRAVAKWQNMRSRNGKIEREFLLTIAQIKQLFRRKTCAYTGVKFVDEENHPLQRTFDRVDSSKGYIPGNVVACTQRINCLKGNATLEEVEQLAVAWRKLVKK